MKCCHLWPVWAHWLLDTFWQMIGELKEKPKSLSLRTWLMVGLSLTDAQILPTYCAAVRSETWMKIWAHKEQQQQQVRSVEKLWCRPFDVQLHIEWDVLMFQGTCLQNEFTNESLLFSFFRQDGNNGTTAGEPVTETYLFGFYIQISQYLALEWSAWSKCSFPLWKERKSGLV